MQKMLTQPHLLLVPFVRQLGGPHRDRLRLADLTTALIWPAITTVISRWATLQGKDMIAFQGEWQGQCIIKKTHIDLAAVDERLVEEAEVARADLPATGGHPQSAHPGRVPAAHWARTAIFRGREGCDVSKLQARLDVFRDADPEVTEAHWVEDLSEVNHYARIR